MPILSVAALVLGLAGPQPPLYCPATLEKLTGHSPITVEYGGILFETCCAGCGNPLVKDPKPLLAEAIKQKLPVGTFIYDPVTGLRIDGAKAPEFVDYKSIRYFFNSKEEVKAFQGNPTAYISDVASEVYFCPVSQHATDWSSAKAFADYQGVRYFLADGASLKAFKASPSKYVSNAAQSVKPLTAVIVKR